MRIFGDVSLVVSPAIGAVACLVAYRRVAGPARYGWALIGAAMASWAAGQLVWTRLELVAHWTNPFPSLADVGYLLTLPLMVLGMAALITARHGKLRTMLDALIVSASLLFVVWAFIGPSVQTAGETRLELVVRLAYPIGDVAMVTMALILLGYVGRDQRRTVAMLAVGALALSLADSSFAYLIAKDAYVPGGFTDVGWFCGFLVMGLAALSAQTGGRRADDTNHSSTLWVALPYVPLAVAIMASVVLTVRHDSIGVFLYYLVVVIVVLVAARQLVSAHDNVALTHQLGVAVHDLRVRERELHYLAFHDQLTKLANRALFRDRAEHAVARQNRTGDLLAALIIDLDGFKQVNDQFGHRAGDLLLRSVADRLRCCVSDADTLARIGGDEFAVIAEGLDSVDGAEIAAGRITQALDESFKVDGRVVKIACSVGVALRHPGPAPLEEMLHRADRAMYAAKLAGKGRYAIAPPERHLPPITAH